MLTEPSLEQKNSADWGLAVRLGLLRGSIKGRHLLRFLRHSVAPKADLLLLGEYHGANVGDLAMAEAIAHRARRVGMRVRLLTLHNLERWKDIASVPAIVGGGTVLTHPQLVRLKARFGADPNRLSILSVNYNKTDELLPHADFLRKIRRLTLRSRAQADVARELLGRDDIAYQPDPVGSSRVDLQACKLEYSIVSPK